MPDIPFKTVSYDPGAWVVNPKGTHAGQEENNYAHQALNMYQQT